MYINCNKNTSCGLNFLLSFLKFKEVFKMAILHFNPFRQRTSNHPDKSRLMNYFIGKLPYPFPSKDRIIRETGICKENIEKFIKELINERQLIIIRMIDEHGRDASHLYLPFRQLGGSFDPGNIDHLGFIALTIDGVLKVRSGYKITPQCVAYLQSIGIKDILWNNDFECLEWAIDELSNNDQPLKTNTINNPIKTESINTDQNTSGENLNTDIKTHKKTFILTNNKKVDFENGIPPQTPFIPLPVGSLADKTSLVIHSNLFYELLTRPNVPRALPEFLRECRFSSYNRHISLLVSDRFQYAYLKTKIKYIQDYMTIKGHTLELINIPPPSQTLISMGNIPDEECFTCEG